MKEKRAVVVGAGLGGLSAAAYLAKKGLQVDLFERNSHPGGYACSFVRGRFEFEASLHELSGIGPAENRGGGYRLLEGCDVARRVEFLPIDDFYTSHFPDFRVTVPHGWEAAEEAYCAQFPKERKGVNRLLGFMRDIATELKMLQSSRRKLDLLAFPYKGVHLVRSMGLTVSQAMDREISDPRLKALFSNIWGYYGLPPSRLSFLLFAIANASFFEYGPYHIKGTSQALSNAFVDAIEDNGGRVHLRSGISRINVSGKRVTGAVTESGDEVAADFVISNANPIHACCDLIGAERIPRSYLRSLAEGRIGVSTFNVYMGLDCTAEELGVTGHELFVNETYDQDEQYRGTSETGRQKYWMLTNYNAADPAFSPPGTCVLVITAAADHSAWTVIPPDRYAETKSRVAEELIEQAERVVPGLSGHIEVVEASTPLTNMRYSNNPGGTFLGTDFGVTGSPLLRPSNRGPLERLYFANAWVRPGGGFETAISSGYLAYGEVMKDLRGARGLAKQIPAFSVD